MNLYGGAGHSFTNQMVNALGRPASNITNSDRRSWRAMLDLFGEVLAP
jgi:hypothetical protein